MSNYLNGNAALKIQDESSSEKWPIFNKVKISKDSQFTIIDPENVYHSFDELMELSRATGLPYKKCVAYRPERLALHETFVGALTTVTLDDDKHQRQVVEDLYDNCILPETKRLAPHFTRRRCEIYKNAFIAVDSLSKGIDISHMSNADVVLKKWKMVQDRIKSGEYTPNHFSEQEVITTLIRDEIFTEEVSDVLRDIVEDRLYEEIDNGNLRALMHPDVDGRMSVVVAGGPGNGKSSSYDNAKEFLDAKGINWQDLNKISSDNFRPTLARGKYIDVKAFSDSTHDEAGTINGKTFERLNDLERAGTYTHYLFDQAYLADDKAKMVRDNGGELFALVVFRDVKKALNGIRTRAKIEGRVVNTQSALSANKEIASTIPELMIKNKGQRFTLKIMDNNGDLNDLKHAMHYNAKKGKLYVCDEEKMQSFIKNMSVNPNATCDAELYSGKAPTVEQYFNEVKSAGIEIIYPGREIDKKVVDINQIISYKSNGR